MVSEWNNWSSKTNRSKKQNKTKQKQTKKKTLLVCASFDKSSLALYSNHKPFRKIAKQRFGFSGSKHSSNRCLLISETLTHKKNN